MKWGIVVSKYMCYCCSSSHEEGLNPNCEKWSLVFLTVSVDDLIIINMN
jgi:hypothetical protein